MGNETSSAKRVVKIHTLPNPDAKPSRGHVTWIEPRLLQNEYEDESLSRPYHCDAVSHRGVDAIGFLPYWQQQDGQWWVFLVRCFRPAQTARPVPIDPPFVVEIIAGVMEEGEQGEQGIRRRTVAEALEEGGFVLSEDRVQPLGPSFLTSPGVYTEMIHLTCAEVNMAERTTPTMDGSVMEELQEGLSLSLAEALSWCNRGDIFDAKTELALRRLNDKLNPPQGSDPTHGRFTAD